MLVLEKVSFKYKKNKEETLKEISCSFSAGTITAITGSSGAGKTTLLTILAGLDKPTDGSLILNGERITDIDAYRRNHVGLISQNYLLFPRRTALENVMYSLTLQGRDQKNAADAAKDFLYQVSIQDELFDHFPSALSGGEQQRVAIARCLAANREILLADEPTGNLDDENAQNIIGLLQKIAHENNKTVIVVTHDKDIARSCDVMYRVKNKKLHLETPVANNIV